MRSDQLPLPPSQGFGTDERTIIDTLSPLGAVEMTAVARTFEAQVGKSLVKVLEKETKGNFEYALRGLAMGPLEWDAWLINRACAGVGTHEECVAFFAADSRFLPSCPPC